MQSTNNLVTLGLCSTTNDLQMWFDMAVNDLQLTVYYIWKGQNSFNINKALL